MEMLNADLVLAWDVENGGEMGALLVCRPCEGSGVLVGAPGRVSGGRCDSCSGMGRLHRPYVLPAAPAPEATPWELAMIQARDRMAAGLGIPPELVPLEGIEANRPAPVVVDLVEALDTAVDLMVGRVKVLRRIRREEIERRERLKAADEITSTTLDDMLAGYGFGSAGETVEQAEQGEDEGNKG